jgi:hypothetical protein
VTGAPLDLRRRLGRFACAPGSVSACADGLRAEGVRVCTFEDLAARAGGPLSLEDATLGDVLDAIVDNNAGYRWEVVLGDLLNVVPLRSILDVPAPALAVEGKAVGRVLEEDLDLRRHGIEPVSGLADGRPIALAARPADLREALNLVVARLPDTVWHGSGRDGAYSLFLTTVERAA